LVCALCTSLPAKDIERQDIRIETEPKSFRANVGDEVTFSLRLVQDGQVVSGQELEYDLTYNIFEPIEKATITTGEQPVKVTTKATRPGFVRISVQAAGNTDWGKVNAASVAVEPEKIEPGQTLPADFDEFWNAQRELVYSTPMYPHLTPVDSGDEKLEAFDLQINCPGGKNCSGYYARPKGAKPGSLPAILYLHPAGVYSSWLNNAKNASKFNAIVYDMNAHGVPNGQPQEFYQQQDQGPLKGYCFVGSEDREKSYFLGMYLRIIRALQFLKEQPEWDGKTLIVRGTSQGGGQAIVAAGLDPDVTLFVTHIAAMCDQSGFLKGHSVGWPRAVFHGNVPRAPVTEYNHKIAETWQYFDAVNFARKAKAAAIVSIGLIDSTCPPCTNYAMFNSLPNPNKVTLDFPDIGHGFPGSVNNVPEILDNMMLEFLQTGKVPPSPVK
jgi:cephalosporin-C deacetylase-like acetyl esterase